ncbi:mannose-1-phosphate guanyltransferase, variant 2 [Microbotryomycetes sp. NB124-2]
MYTHEFTWPKEAASVIVTGSFDDWKSTVQLTKELDGRLTAKLPINYGEKITYKYVVDGTWQHNPLEPTETDGSGNTNNVFTAPDAPAPTQVVETPATKEEPVLPVPAAVATNDASTLASANAVETVPAPAAAATESSSAPAVTESSATAAEPTVETKAATDNKAEESPSLINVATAGAAAVVTGAAALAGSAISTVTGSKSPLTLVSSKDEPSKTAEAPITPQDELAKEPAPTPAVVPATSAAVSTSPAPAAVDQAILSEKRKEEEHKSSSTAPVVTAVAGGAAAAGAGAAALANKASSTETAPATQRSSSFQRAEQQAEGYMKKAAVEADKYKDQASAEFNKRYAQGEQMAHNAYDKVAASSFGASTMKALGLDKHRNEPQPQPVTQPQPVVPAESVAPAIPIKDTAPAAPAAAVAPVGAGVAAAPAVAASSNKVPAASQAPVIPVQPASQQSQTQQPQHHSNPIQQAEQTVKQKFNGLGNGQPGQQSSSEAAQPKPRKPSLFKRMFGKDKSK